MQHTSGLLSARGYHIFSILSHKRHDLQQQKYIYECKMCVLIFSAMFSVIFLILRRIQQTITVNVHSPSTKVPVVLFRFLKKLELSRKIFEKYSNIEFHENPSVRAELFRAEGQTERGKQEEAKSLLRSSAITPKNGFPLLCF